MTQGETQELKPCPFCGCAAEKRLTDGPKRGFIGCFTCMIGLPFNVPYGDAEVAAWNIRAPVDSQGAELAREAYDYFMGPQACGDFTCACGNAEACGVCEIRQRFERWLGGQPDESPAATQMRTACVEKVRELLDSWRKEMEYENEDFDWRVETATKIVTALESLTLDQVKQESDG